MYKTETFVEAKAENLQKLKSQHLNSSNCRNAAKMNDDIVGIWSVAGQME